MVGVAQDVKKPQRDGLADSQLPTGVLRPRSRSSAYGLLTGSGLAVRPTTCRRHCA